mgnify:CR=1 FL=1|jgi:DnaJ-class molecular chaperone with C-terminal Zn finger domain
MTHYAVLVVLPHPPTKAALDRSLAPWHEFDGTGYDHEYVVEEDITRDALDDAGRARETRVKDPDGIIHDPYDDEAGLKPQFSRWDAERERQFFHVPEGFEEIRLTLEEAGVDAAGWIAENNGFQIVRGRDVPDLLDAHKFGWVRVDDDGHILEVVKRTNPNGKWDYWLLGGRYSGRLQPGYDPEKDPANLEDCFICDGTGRRDDRLGQERRAGEPSFTCNGCHGSGKQPKWPSKWLDIGNTSRWGDLDMPGLKATRIEERRAFVEDIRKKTGLTMDDIERGVSARKTLHDVWSELPEPRPRGPEYGEWLKTQPHGDIVHHLRVHDTWSHIAPDEGESVGDWIEAAPAITAYAVVIEGTWCSKGEVGWFGISTGEKDDWQSQLEAILQRIPDDHYVAFVDCHT